MFSVFLQKASLKAFTTALREIVFHMSVFCSVSFLQIILNSEVGNLAAFLY